MEAPDTVDLNPARPDKKDKKWVELNPLRN